MTRTPFTIWYGGGEVPGWRKLLHDNDAPMQISFKGLLRRLPKVKPYTLADRYPEESRLFLDSGGHSFNREPGKTSVDDLKAYAARYEAFVADNVDRVELVSEFDSVALGPDWIAERRSAFYDQLDPKKFMPVWHPADGEDTLRRLGAAYDVLGVTATTHNGRDLTQSLNSVARAGVHLHGIAMTKPDDLRSVDFSSAASTSWLSPQKYGDTIIWDGNTLHRYPMAYKERSRRQHAMLITREGFDIDKIMNDDPTEVVKLALWSWQQFQAAVVRRKGLGKPAVNPFQLIQGDSEAEVTTISQGGTEGGFAQSGDPESTHQGSGDSTEPPTGAVVHHVRAAAQREERTNLPVLGFEPLTSSVTSEDGTVSEDNQLLMRSVSGSARVCDNCFLSERCPMMQPHAVCAFDIPIEVKTVEQAAALRSGLIEMQSKRVAMLQFAEDVNGGQPDPNLSVELDRLWKHLSAKAEIEDTRSSIDFSFKAKGGGQTLLDTIFGRDPAGVYPGETPPYMDAAAVNREMAQLVSGEVIP